ncbi:molybdopterin-guanine dinucleotide biosynthesis protein MobA [Microbacterium sp. CH12i]|uniref:molybdenum cofactor guanylyltransferase n=1 Tax=Microbacterium sp. CH12i TaxID=1479651 RepID=UPI0004615923|nr:nucleotidyltransferase family protein [Microbacterium sp. CH12i]KDA06855.1 molybdopterin-guanine dinucleotide biosynthesis protein MobA [Microbacterium sp. CH12i]
MTPLVPVAAIVLTGGRASRLGGIDKASMEIDGIPLVNHVYAAVHDCAPIIAVGPDETGRPGVRVVREEPRFGGPVAAIAAGLAALDDSEALETWILACDLPLAPTLVERLSQVPLSSNADAVIAVDVDGREQWLAGRYRISSLRKALAQFSDPAGASVRALVAPLTLLTVTDEGSARDLDTWADIDEHRSRRKDQNV